MPVNKSGIVRFIKTRRLEFISFITGFSLLTYELAAARVLAPSIGSSTYVWTGVIGVIIAALSLGFFAGGKVADARNRLSDLVALLLLAAGCAVLTLLTYEGILQSIVDSFEDNRVQAVVAALTLFAPTSFFIGMTSPYLAKLNVRSLKETGQSIASLDMLNAIGGILGTFVTGFILFGYIGSHEAIGLVAVLLLLASWLVAPRLRVGRRLLISALLILCAFTPASVVQGITSIDTASAHYQVIDGFIDERLVTGLVTGPTGTQSAVYQNGTGEPVFWYVREAARVTTERSPESVLVLGGGAFTLPQYLSEQLPDASITVVEIDPELEAISREHFGYRNPSNVSEVFTDARAYLNQTDERYDVVVVDVYGDSSIPFTFITDEYGAAIRQVLKPGGIVIANIIGGLEGKCREALTAVDAAYRAHLPFARYAVEPGRDARRANHLIVYSERAEDIQGFRELSLPDSRPYTDNFAPAERLYYDCQQAKNDD
jgi:predicted membrane-bound spermidine synthase